MNTKIVSPLGIVALVLGLLPLCALLPGAFGYSLTDEVRTGWMLANFAFIAASLVLAIIVKGSSEDQGAGTKVVATAVIVLDVFWALLVIGLFALAFVVSFQSGQLLLL